MSAESPGGSVPDFDSDHCVTKIVEIVRRGEDSRKSILQLGYNLGRLSELTGLGREPFWDRWKDPVAGWDREILASLADELCLLREQGWR